MKSEKSNTGYARGKAFVFNSLANAVNDNSFNFFNY